MLWPQHCIPFSTLPALSIPSFLKPRLKYSDAPTTHRRHITSYPACSSSPGKSWGLGFPALISMGVEDGTSGQPEVEGMWWSPVVCGVEPARLV